MVLKLIVKGSKLMVAQNSILPGRLIEVAWKFLSSYAMNKAPDTFIFIFAS